MSLLYLKFYLNIIPHYKEPDLWENSLFGTKNKEFQDEPGFFFVPENNKVLKKL